VRLNSGNLQIYYEESQVLQIDYYNKIVKPVNLQIIWNVQEIYKFTESYLTSNFTNLLKISGNLQIYWKLFNGLVKLWKNEVQSLGNLQISWNFE
jgi:hypothetical protein